jgi:hypothetical protein
MQPIIAKEKEAAGMQPIIAKKKETAAGITMVLPTK